MASIREASGRSRSGIGAPTRYERILATLGADAYARASAATRQVVTAPTEHQRTIRGVAAGVAGPLLYSYVRWTAEQAQQLGIRRLYFIARDGDILMKIAQACPDLTRNYDLRYLYGSRHSWYLAGIDPTDLASQPWLTEDAVALTPALFLARLGVQPKDIASSLDAKDLPDTPLGEDGLRGIMRVLSQPAAASRITDAVADRRATVHRYLAQEGLFDGDPSAVVDLGWAGRMFSALAAAVTAGGSCMPHVFLFGLQRIVPINFPCTAWLFDTSNPADVPVRRIAAALEAFCLSPTGHLTGYARGDQGVVLPILNYEASHESQRWGVAILQNTIVTFATLLGGDGHRPTPPLDRDTALALLDTFWCQPSRTEAAVWSRCPYEVDQQAHLPARLAQPLRLTESIRRSLAGNDPWAGQAWPGGARRLTPYTVRIVLSLIGRRYKSTPRSL